MYISFAPMAQGYYISGVGVIVYFYGRVLQEPYSQE